MMKETERIMNGIQRLTWGVLGLGCLAGAMLCLLMWAAYGDGPEVTESVTGHGKKEEGPWDTGC